MTQKPSTLGRLAYLLYYAPRAWLARSRRAGGPYQQWCDTRGRQAMQAAARRLPPILAASAESPEIHLLTGRRFWYQTAFCLSSLAQQGVAFRPVLVDDGTFDPALGREVRRLFPHARILLTGEIEAHLDAVLPERRFPTLRAQRRTYLHLRKLTDVHAGRQGARLVLDSDMLFFRPPHALSAWLANPTRPIHMLDVHNAYGYPLSTLQELAGRPVPERVNVGVCGCRSEWIDWEKLEHGATQLLAQHGTSYYLEQALVALLFASTETIRLPRNDYLLMPELEECRRPTATLHHYVDLSKRGYFRAAWRHVVS